MERRRIHTAMARRTAVLKESSGKIFDSNVRFTVYSNQNERNTVRHEISSKVDREDGLVWEPLLNETSTSHDVGMINSMLSKLHPKEIINYDTSDLRSNSDGEDDIFHETDFDDSDYIPSDSNSISELNSTSESIREMANILELNLNNSDSPELSGDILPTTSSSLTKRINKRNKNLGKEYVTYKNQIIYARRTQKLGQCRQKCHTKFSFEQQKSLFETYWSLGEYNKRRQILSNLIEVQTKETEILQKSKNPRNRQYVYLYYFAIHGQRTRVCKQCFLKIFGETEQSIKTICKYKTKEFGGVILNDRRGMHAPVHKLSIERHSEVVQFINQFPKYQSHYSRRHTEKVYFQRGLNLTTLYYLYTKETSQPVSETKFQQIFHTLNIKFKKPQLDLCTYCETIKAKIKNTENEDDKSQLSSQLTTHHDQADFAYECKKTDKQLSKCDKSVKMFSFDIQQCLPTPYLNASMFFSKRPLWTYNFTMHDGATKEAHCYIWYEAIAKRGANDIGSCIFKCLLALPSSVRHVILYSDSCPGQNRNSFICAMFSRVLEDHQSMQTIDHKFLIVGHTHLECDTVHAQIEKKKKKSSGSLQHPHDWANLIAATNAKYKIHKLKQEDFYDFKALSKDKYNWKTNNTAGNKFEWKFIRWIRYEKDKPGILQYKLSLKSDEHFKELNINSRRRKIQNSTLSQCYASELPISVNKKRDLLEMLPLINSSFHNFYQNLKSEGEYAIEIDSDLDEMDNIE